MPAPVYKTLRETFEALILSKDDCWIFSRAHSNGYGRFSFKGIRYYAHRVSWILYKGDIPNGLNVLHECDNPICCNPDHLFLGTQSDNALDMVSKNRHVVYKGESNTNHVLTEADVVVIREKFSSGYYSHRELAEKFDVTKSTITKIINRETWSHVP